MSGLPSHADVRLALGMLHFAAAAGSGEAAHVLGNRYVHGTDLPQNDELGMWYISVAAEHAADNYFQRGNQVRWRALLCGSCCSCNRGVAVLGRPCSLTSRCSGFLLTLWRRWR